MLKHMLNSGANAAAKQSALDSGRRVEPEYQNTGVHSPNADLYRAVRINKPVRSVENRCDSSDSSRQRAEPAPARPGIPGISETLHNPRLPSRGSVLNHSYAGNPHPFIQQRLNQSDLVVGRRVSPNFSPISGPAPVGNGSTPVSNGPIQILTPIANGPIANGPIANGPIANGPTKPIANGGLHISKCTPHNNVDSNPDNSTNGDLFSNGIKEILTSLGLLCLISLLLALLSLIFLLKISPVTAADMKDMMRTEQLTIISPDEYVTVYEVTLALCALSLSLNLCCLLVCSVQFLFAVKLARSSVNGDRTNKYLQKSAVTRVCAIGGFFVSIPVFLTGVILYTFIQFHSTPAIITSVLIGSGIVFCGCAMVHNVFVWQKEKTNAVKALVRRQKLHQQLEASKRSISSKVEPLTPRDTSNTALSTSTIHNTTSIDMNSVNSTPHELSTLV